MGQVRSCWSCKGPLESAFFCPTCEAIQPPDPAQDHFAFFELERGFEVDLERLESRFHELQQLFHPDRFAVESAKARRFSLEQATRLNEGRQTLQDPLLRAEYLLKLLAGDAEIDAKGAQDPAFLMEVIELRETLEELDPEADDIWDRIEALRDEVSALAAQEIEQLKGAFGRYDGDSQWHTVMARHTDRLRYHRKFLEEVDRLEERLF
uniref:Co-chaperone protein HscB homolog n=1 Tax=Magnetococcus massalia (strain MO-1) TaxID=451514 RepID=A0A1S7LE08_MAGMO|nr:Putative hscB: Fe-S protein assembly co-chaperone Hsc [Candidatus Magnetococcus massalia]